MTDDIEEDFDIFRGSGFEVDMDGTKEWHAFADSIFGDILPACIAQSSLRGAITNPLGKLVNTETYYISMYDCPEKLYEQMDMATNIYLRYYDYLEENKLLLPTNGFSPRCSVIIRLYR